MNQELELELTFLAKELPQGIKTVRPTRIVDIYIPDTPEHSHLRLRQKGDKYEITKKMPVAEGNASEQIEQTIPLTKDEFIAGGLLAGKTYDDISSELKRFNYRRLE